MLNNSMKNYFSSSTRGAQIFLITALVGTLLGMYTYEFGLTELVLVLLGYFVCPLYKGVKIFTLDYVNEVSADTKWRMRELVTDKFQQFLHRYYFAILIAYSGTLFIIGGFWLMIFAHWMPAVITGLMSNVVNYVGHKPSWYGGFRTYNLKDQSTNNWLWAIPSWGESWHNNHHRHPKNFSLGEKWWQLDISALVIKVIREK